MSEANQEHPAQPGLTAQSGENEALAQGVADEDPHPHAHMSDSEGRTAAEHLSQAAQTADAAGRPEGEPSPNLEFLLDIPMQVTVELGRRSLLMHDLLRLGQGSVIELTQQVGEPFQVLVNQKLIARGEIVAVNDKFGVRITDIISPIERVQQL